MLLEQNHMSVFPFYYSTQEDEFSDVEFDHSISR